MYKKYEIRCPMCGKTYKPLAYQVGVVCPKCRGETERQVNNKGDNYE